MGKSIILTEDQLVSLLGEETVAGYEDFSAEADHSSGTFDSEKGAMYDYDIFLYNDKTGEEYYANAGYYTGVTGDCFNSDIEFTLKVKRKPATKKASKPITESQLKKSLQALVKKAGDVKVVKKVLSTIK